MEWTERGLLCVTDGTEQLYVWTYLDFECYDNKSITPSMYRAMAEYVKTHIPESYLKLIRKREWFPKDINAQAFDWYQDLSYETKKKLHEKEMKLLEEVDNEEVRREESMWH